MRPVCHSLGHVIDVLTSVKSNDITNIFVKSTLVQKIAYNCIYDITMSPEQFKIKNKDLCPLQRLKQTAINCAFKFRL